MTVKNPEKPISHVEENKESSQRSEYYKSPLFDIKKVFCDAGEKSLLSQEEKEKLFNMLDEVSTEKMASQEDIYFSLEFDDIDTPIKKLVSLTDKKLHEKKEVAKAYTYLVLTGAAD